MRSITLLCSLLLLAACGPAPLQNSGKAPDEKEIKVGPFTNDESSPIIVADGSVHLRQNDLFRVHSGKKASVRLSGYAPTWLGYKCDPGTPGSPGANPPIPSTSGDCTSTCAGTVLEKCKVDLTGLSNWSLDVFDPTLVATFSWNKAKAKDRVVIEFPKNTSYTVTDGKVGVDLVPSLNNLKAAALTVDNDTKPSYSFKCATGECVTIGYYCATNCPAKD